ncbi:hypothetical protein Pfo_000306 [Paulownia fortunei]|nr:hypothetical protein Pfo_000306 [Paulownia fortunei]
MNLNFSPSPFPIEQLNDDHDQHHQPFAPNHQVVSSSSSSASCNIFFNSTQDHTGYYHRQLYQPHHHEDDNYAYHGGSSYEIKNKVNSGLKLTLWKKEDQGPAQSISDKDNSLKWMPSKMRLMQRMKNPDCAAPKISSATAKFEDQKLQPSSSLETDLNSNSSSYNRNSPIRVCADCNTTKTPLWRSGPKGPKSLCNACGIRQRKARRAMAAAAAAANGAAVASDLPPAMKIKAQHKEKMGKNCHSSQLKKRCKMAAATATPAGSSASGGQKKLGFEDFLINLSNSLAFHRVFPEDEKDAAILLMALSSGLVHS